MDLAGEWAEGSTRSVGHVDHRGGQSHKGEASASPLFSSALLFSSFHTVLLLTYLLILGESDFQLLLFLNFSLLTVIGVSKLELHIQPPNLTAGFCFLLPSLPTTLPNLAHRSQLPPTCQATCRTREYRVSNSWCLP